MSEKLDAQKKALLSGSVGTALSRIEAFLDSNSFMEIGTWAGTSQDMPAQSVVAGYGLVDARPVYVYAQDESVKGAAMTQAQAAKINRVMELAAKTGAPVVSLLGSNGAKVDEGASVMNAYASILAKSVSVSGVVPQISILLGQAGGAASFLLSLTDVCIAVKGKAAAFMTGAQIVSSASGKDVSLEKLGGAETLGKTGVSALVAGDEQEAFAKARKLISLLPSNNLEDAPLADTEDLNRAVALDGYESAKQAAAALADFGDALELNADFGFALYTGLAKIGGRSVGLVISNPEANNGKLCQNCCRKAARFVQLCDSFNLPIVTLVNSDGFLFADENQNAQAIAQGAHLVYAYAQATSPKICVIAGNAVGSAYIALCSQALGADVTYAWPDAYIAPMNADAAVRVVESDKVNAGQDVEELKAVYAENNDAFTAARLGLVDDVIEPAATRQMIAGAVDMLLGKREDRLPRKHGNLPL